MISRFERWLWVPLGGVLLALYVLTLSPGVLGGDPGELQFVPAILGLPHPTGTPLYVLLGKAWSLLPLGPTVAWRMSLLAALSAGLAAVLVYHTVYLLVQRILPALVGALSLAVGLTFWEQALLADKYAFNALLVALVVYLALRWAQRRAPGTLLLLAAVFGLSLAHHRTMALLAPSLLLYVGWFERGALLRDRRRLLRLALAVLAPLLLYLYLPWAEARGLPPGTWRPRSLSAWRDYLLDTGFTGQVYLRLDELGQTLLFYARTLLADFTWPGLLLGVGGLAWLIRRRPADALFLGSNFLLQAVLAANHHVPRQWVYFIPSFLLFAIWVGAGAGALWSGVERLVGGPPVVRARAAAGERGVRAQREEAWQVWTRIVGYTVLGGVLLAWPLVPVPARYRPLRAAHLGAGVLDPWRQTLKQGYMGDRVGAAIDSLAPDAVVVCDWEQATTLWYYQQVEGQRPDVTIVYPMERLDEAAASGRPLYVARVGGGLADRWHPSCSESLLALHTEPQFDSPAESTPVGLVLSQGDGSGVFELAGYRYGAPDGRRLPPPGAEGPVFARPMVVPLTLHWRALAAPAHDYSVSLRLLDGAGGQVFQIDSQHPALGTYPTSRWTAGEVVSDYYEIQLAADWAPGTYRWGVVLYRALPEGGWESLRVAGIGQELAPGGTIEVR